MTANQILSRAWPCFRFAASDPRLGLIVRYIYSPRPHSRESSMPRLGKRKRLSTFTSAAQTPRVKRRRINPVRAQIMTANNTKNGKGGDAGSLLEDPIDYTDLKAWIQQQETNPKPLSHIQ